MVISTKHYTIWFGMHTPLTAHNREKWRSRLLTSPCHQIHSVESLGLPLSNYTKKYQFCENVRFVAISWKFYILSITVRIYRSFCTYVKHITYNCNYLIYTTIRLYLSDFQLNTDFPLNFSVFYRKVPITLVMHSVSQECF